MSYGGGNFGGGSVRVGVTTGAPEVYLVFWGSQWGTEGTDSNGYVTLSGDPHGIAPYLQAFIAGLGTRGETWSGVMSEYCQGPQFAAGSQTCPASNTHHVSYPTGGALAGVWLDGSSAAPQQATGSQIGAEAVSAAQHFGNTTATANRNAQYVIVSPTGTNPDGFNTSNPNSDFCAWHDYTGDSSLTGGAVTSPSGPIAFTNLPYLTDAGGSCGQNFVNSGSAGTLDGVSIVEGHEYAETITDQFPAGGWTDSGGNETGDKCAWIQSGQGASQNITLATGTFAVQSTWANDANSGAGGCEIAHPLVTNNNITVANPGNQTSTPAQQVSLQIASSDTSPTVKYTASGLPAGLSISTSGLVSGTPTTPGSSNVTVFAFDSTGPSGSTTFSWAVGNPTSTGVSCAPSSLMSGTATTCTATIADIASGGVSTPTGAVSFSASPTSEGTFSGSATCTLTPTGTNGTSSCDTTYTPTAAGSQIVDAVYQGDGKHIGSTNSTSLTVSAPQTGSSGGGGSGGGGSQSSGSSSSQPASGATQSSAAALGPSPAPTPSGGTVTTKPAGPACSAATGHLTGSTLGLIKLGMSRAQARAAYRRSSLTGLRYQDVFCLLPTGLRVGYPSPSLLRSVASGTRATLSGHVVWATTANKHFSAHGIRPGVRVASAKRVLTTARSVLVGRVAWYFLPGRVATIVIAVRGGVVEEVGIASKWLTQTSRADSLLARNLS